MEIGTDIDAARIQNGSFLDLMNLKVTVRIKNINRINVLSFDFDYSLLLRYVFLSKF